MKKLLVLSIVLVPLIFLAACKGSQESLSLVGSTSVAPLAEDLGEKYSQGQVDIQSVGSSAGIKAASDGTAEIGMSSRDLKSDEKSGLEEFKIALDGLVVIINPKNDIKDLTIKELLSIYKGEITNWKEVGGKDAPITVISREEGSGSRGAFEELVGLENKESKASLLLPVAIIADGNGAVKQNVGVKDNAIGYLSLGSVDGTVKAINIAGTAPTLENVINGSYKLVRPFIIITKGQPSEKAKKFIDFILSGEGQKIVKEKGYVPVN